MTLFPRVVELLRDQGASDVLVTGGGIISKRTGGSCRRSVSDACSVPEPPPRKRSSTSGTRCAPGARAVPEGDPHAPRILSADDAAALVPEGASVLMGGFGLCGIPENLIKRSGAARHRQSHRGRATTPAWPTSASGSSSAGARSRRWWRTYVGENPLLRGHVSSTASSRSSSCPRGRSPSASAPRAPGSRPSSPRPASAPSVAEGKEVRVFDGREYVLERGLAADFAFVKAYKADRAGNLVYRRDGAQLQPDDGDRRARRRSPRSKRSSSVGSTRSRGHRHTRHLRERASCEERSTMKSASSKERIVAAERPRAARTGSTSTSASACRPWSPTTSPRA